MNSWLLSGCSALRAQGWKLCRLCASEFCWDTVSEM